MTSPYLCTDSHRENSIWLAPVYSVETRPTGKIGCDHCISSLNTIDAFSMALAGTISAHILPSGLNGQSGGPALRLQVWVQLVS